MGTLLLLLLCSGLSGVISICYFPAAYQGEFVSQAVLPSQDSLTTPEISYSTISVLYDSIPLWGYCHNRIGSNVILMDDTGGITCFRCFQLSLRSSNVLQIHTAALDKCYTTEDKALADCPSEMTIREKRSREIMLYRKSLILVP